MPPRSAYTDADLALASEVGARIRALRVERGYKNPADLARKLGENENWSSNLSKIETGRHLPRPLLLLQLAKALGVTSSFLLGDEDPTRARTRIDAERQYQLGYENALVDIQEHARELRRRGRNS